MTINEISTKFLHGTDQDKAEVREYIVRHENMHILHSKEFLEAALADAEAHSDTDDIDDAIAAVTLGMVLIAAVFVIALFVLTMLIPSPANAGPDRAYVLVGSKHLGTEYEFNEVNPGLFLTWELDHFDVTVGAYHNSYSSGSLAASAAYPLMRGEDWSVDVFAGLATYFGTTNPDIVPMAGLQARYGPAFVQYMPVPGGQYINGLISFGLTFEIGD